MILKVKVLSKDWPWTFCLVVVHQTVTGGSLGYGIRILIRGSVKVLGMHGT